MPPPPISDAISFIRLSEFRVKFILEIFQVFLNNKFAASFNKFFADFSTEDFILCFASIEKLNSFQ